MINAKTAQADRIKSLAEEMLLFNKNHYLSRLAVQETSRYYAIEERVISTHNYFASGASCKETYEYYVKVHGGKDNCTILRVEESAENIQLDQADHNGLIIEKDYKPQEIDIWKGENFLNDKERDDPINWGPLVKWLA